MLLGWVRLRWPISDAALAASRRTAVPPSRPAIQASDNASRLSSCSRATLTCSIRLPRRDQLVKGTGVRRPAHRLAQRLVAEHLRELGKDLQVLLGRLFGNQQHEYQADGIAVGGVEGHRLRGPQERAQRLLQSLDAAVRNRYPLAEPGRAEALAREQAVEDQAAGEAVMVLEQQAGLLEQPLLARYLQVEHDVVGAQKIGDETHWSARIIRASPLQGFSLIDRRDLQRLTVFCNRAAGHYDTLLAEDLGDARVRKRGFRVLGGHQLLDQRADRGRRRGAAGLGGDVAAEEILELESAARRGHVLLRGDARDGAFMQPERLRYLAQHQRPHRDFAVLEEMALLLDDRLRYAQDGVEALLHVLDQPARLLQLGGDGGAAVARSRRELGVQAVDRHAAHGVVV